MKQNNNIVLENTFNFIDKYYTPIDHYFKLTKFKVAPFIVNLMHIYTLVKKDCSIVTLLKTYCIYNIIKNYIMGTNINNFIKLKNIKTLSYTASIYFSNIYNYIYKILCKNNLQYNKYIIKKSELNINFIERAFYGKNELIYNKFILNTKKKNSIEDIKYDFYKKITKHLFGQNKIIEQIINKLTKSDNITHSRPLANWLFCGPSGTGKTELAKTLSIYLYKRKNIVHINMSELQEPHSVSKLIGSPPGYTGSNKTSKLLSQIIKNPSTIVLFDEIEKAHKNVFSIFLQILEDGVLTGSKGIKGHFNKAFIIFTSNLGCEIFNQINTKQLINNSSNNYIKQVIDKTFSPEFVNRLDYTLIFNPLNTFSLYKLTNKSFKICKHINYIYNCIVKKKTKYLLSLFPYKQSAGARALFKNINSMVINDNNLSVLSIYLNKYIKCLLK